MKIWFPSAKGAESIAWGSPPHWKISREEHCPATMRSTIFWEYGVFFLVNPANYVFLLQTNAAKNYSLEVPE
ncbi:MAG: hypothetical protein JJU34_01575 [Lunatimonas sp.]|uniref:hypothetical protein n=1 Tax=Lunatimonas sp. TaxID=2060141 RepID=UPI00263B7AB3|nr:hypothetical protein [Lunatimonas sp.]MCC5935947.1 hypothetical protein [Lunatimonas sp.]